MIGMRGWLRAGTCSVVMVAVAWTVAACGSEPAIGGVRSSGVVESVDVAERTVTLDHEEIPGLMSAMKMQFKGAPDVALEGLAPGERVEFWVEEELGQYTVTGIRTGS